MTSVLAVQRQTNAERRAWLAEVAEREPTGECIDWPWGTNSYGYGRIAVDGVQRLVTHIVLEAVGLPRPPAPADRALHSCDRPLCVAPWHLRWGTQRQNAEDAISRGRVHPPVLSGEAHGRARLTYEQVTTIRRRAAAGATRAALAREYGVGRTTIRHIITGRNWSADPTRQEE